MRLKTNFRISRPFYVFMVMLFVFVIMQIGVDQFFVMVQKTTNGILSGGTAQIVQPIKDSTLSPSATTTNIHSFINSLNLTIDRLIENREVFIRSAFRVSNREIRLTVLKEYKNRKAIFYEYGNMTGQISLKCNLPKCIEPFSPKCKVVGYIGQIFIANELENSTILRLRMDNSQEIVEIPIIDVRPKRSGYYEHQLGVCVQPIYMHAEFVVFIQFFEHWLARGATKFYIYRHSYSKEVQTILDLYINTSTASIEFVDWSNLPSKNPDFQPSRYVYRLEVMISIFDCLNRARNNVKYLAQTDLDEMVIVQNERNNLTELMDNLSENHPKMASVSLVSRRARIPPTFENITTLQDLNFSQFAEISAEAYFFPRFVYTKMIHRPERTFHAHIHRYYGADQIAGSDNPKETYHLVNVTSSFAYVLHLRRVMSRNFKLHRFFPIQILKSQSEEWQQNFHNRIKNYGNISTHKWDSTGLEILKQVEKCRTKHEDRRLRECHSVFDCDSGVNKTDWFIASNSWYLLY